MTFTSLGRLVMYGSTSVAVIVRALVGFGLLIRGAGCKTLHAQLLFFLDPPFLEILYLPLHSHTDCDGHQLFFLVPRLLELPRDTITTDNKSQEETPCIHLCCPTIFSFDLPHRYPILCALCCMSALK